MYLLVIYQNVILSTTKVELTILCQFLINWGNFINKNHSNWLRYLFYKL